MLPPPPLSTRTATLFPYTTLFRSAIEIGNQLLRLRDGGPHLRLVDDERGGGFLLHNLVLVGFEEKRVAVRERDIAAHGVDLVCVDAGHDRLHAFGPTITVRIGAVEQGYMGRRVSELDLLEHSLPYVGGQKIGTAGQGVAEVEADCLG